MSGPTIGTLEMWRSTPVAANLEFHRIVAQLKPITYRPIAAAPPPTIHRSTEIQSAFMRVVANRCEHLQYKKLGGWRAKRNRPRTHMGVHGRSVCFVVCQVGLRWPIFPLW